MESFKWAIRIGVAALAVVLVFFVLNAVLGLGLFAPASPPPVPPEPAEGPGDPAPSARQALLPEVYLNGPTGSERIEIGGTRVLSGPVSLTFRFAEPVDIEKEGAVTVESSLDGKTDRFSMGYAGADKTIVWMNIPETDLEEETLKIEMARDIPADGEAFLREPVVLYMTRYGPNRADIRQILSGRFPEEHRYWLTGGTKVFDLYFERPVAVASVERAVLENLRPGAEPVRDSVSFEWKTDREVRITLENPAEGPWAIDLTGAEDRIGLRMQGAPGQGNYWAFDIGPRQSLKTYNLETGVLETLETGVFDELRYLSGRIDGEGLHLHLHEDPNRDVEGLLYDAYLYDGTTGTVKKTEGQGSLETAYQGLLEEGQAFRGIKLSPDGSKAAAFAARIGTAGERGKPVLMIIDTQTGALEKTLDMPFFLYAAGDGILPLDLHFTWISDTVLFTEGFEAFGNTAHIYGINLETDAVVLLKENVREPEYLENLELLTAVKLEKTGEGTVQRDGSEPEEIDWYGDSEIILMGIYGNVLKYFDPIEGYGPAANGAESLAYDAPVSRIASWGNQLVYPESAGGASRLVIQDLGEAKTEYVDAGMDFLFLGVKDGKAYLLEKAE